LDEGDFAGKRESWIEKREGESCSIFSNFLGTKEELSLGLRG